MIASTSNHAFRTKASDETGRSTATDPKHGHGFRSPLARFAITTPVNNARSAMAANAGTGEYGKPRSATATTSSTVGTTAAAATESGAGTPSARIWPGSRPAWCSFGKAADAGTTAPVVAAGQR